MAALQRSAISFRRQGSSGLVWEDRFSTGDSNQTKDKQEEGETGDAEFKDLKPTNSVRSAAMTERSSTAASMERSRSAGHGRTRRSGKISPAIDPPSPKVSGCGFCLFQRQPTATRPNSRKR